MKTLMAMTILTCGIFSASLAQAENVKVEALAELLADKAKANLKSCIPQVSERYFYFKRSQDYFFFTTEPKAVCFRVERPNPSPATYLELLSKSDLAGSHFSMMEGEDPWLVYQPLASRKDMTVSELTSSGALVTSEDMAAAIRRGVQIVVDRESVESMQYRIPNISIDEVFR